MRRAALGLALPLLLAGFAAAQPSAELRSALDFSVKKLRGGSFKNVHSYIVSLEGTTILEEYFNGHAQDGRHILQSQTKSVVALLCGIAIDRGFIESEAVPVMKFFPEAFDKSDALRSSLTIREVLTMSAGLKWEEMLPPDDPGNDNMNMFRGDRYLDYVLARPMDKPPFSEFKYNSGCPMIIAGIIQKAARLSLDKFAETYLFGPLGITDYEWLKDSTGLPHAGGGLSLRPSDMLKIGELVLNEGQWNGKTVVSKEWIAKATRPYFATEFGGAGFGYFWWIQDMKIDGDRTTTVISARGAGGQNMFVVPEFRLVVSFTEGNYTTPLVGPMILREGILPALAKARKY
jgi:CubicO group peptidase (beta-lactamase class C family)